MGNNMAPKRGSMKEAEKSFKEKQDAQRDLKTQNKDHGILNHKVVEGINKGAKKKKD